MHISIIIHGNSHDGLTWPNVIITVNEVTMWTGVCQEKTNISFSFEPQEHNTLSIRHYNKSFGENRVWHTTATSDRNITVEEIKIDHVDIHNLLYLGATVHDFNGRQLDDFYKANQDPPYLKTYVHKEPIFMGYNGTYILQFPKEVYDWIIVESTKFNRPVDPTKQSSLNSVNWRLDWINSSEVFHILDEIEDYISKI